MTVGKNWSPAFAGMKEKHTSRLFTSSSKLMGGKPIFILDFQMGAIHLDNTD